MPPICKSMCRALLDIILLIFTATLQDRYYCFHLHTSKVTISEIKKFAQGPVFNSDKTGFWTEVSLSSKLIQTLGGTLLCPQSNWSLLSCPMSFSCLPVKFFISKVYFLELLESSPASFKLCFIEEEERGLGLHHRVLRSVESRSMTFCV